MMNTRSSRKSSNVRTAEIKYRHAKGNIANVGGRRAKPRRRTIAMLVKNSSSSGKILVNHGELRNTTKVDRTTRQNRNTLDASSFFHISDIVKNISNFGILIFFIMIGTPPNPNVRTWSVNGIQHLGSHLDIDRSEPKLIITLVHGIAHGRSSVDESIRTKLRLKRLDLIHISTRFNNENRVGNRVGIVKRVLKRLLNSTIGVRQAGLADARALVSSLISHFRNDGDRSGDEDGICESNDLLSDGCHENDGIVGHTLKNEWQLLRTKLNLGR